MRGISARLTSRHRERSLEFDAPRRGGRSSPPPPAVQAEALVQTFNSWAFKREQPDNSEKLKAAAAHAIHTETALGFVLYWGRGPRGDVGGPERRCLDYLSALTGRVMARHAPGAEMTLICTDTHAELNGYSPLSTRRYFAQVTAEAERHGFRTCFLSDLVQWAEDRIDEGRASELPSDETLRRLEGSAAKWYRGGGSIKDGARRYFRANMIERQAVESAFPNAIFVTFNGSDQRPLFPESMPIFYMYSVRRGVAVKPWFMADEGCLAVRRSGGRAVRPEPAPVRLLPNGDAALVAEFGDTVDPEINARVLALADRIAEAGIDGVVETQPTFRSLLVCFDPALTSYRALAPRVAALAAGPQNPALEGRLWRLPVCYDRRMAPDLDEAAARARLLPDALIARHSGMVHRVYMLGFLPGQPYLGDLPAELALPRRVSPRARVAAGSVGIAQHMTCLFPRETPCGLNLIGRTPAPLWDPRRREAALLAPGDRVIFSSISLDLFERLTRAVQHGEPICAPEGGTQEAAA